MLNAFTPNRFVSLAPRSLQHPGSRTPYCWAVPAKLYEFDRIVRFGREIAATDNAAALRRCFYDYGTFILPRQWMFALRAREYLSL
jgi:hypothetical protein